MATFYITDLTDPNELNRQFPQTVKIMNRMNLSSVEVGHYVKIRRNSEYFWVHVTEINGNSITGKVYLKPYINEYEIDDLLIFDKCFIFDCYDAYIFNLYPGTKG